MGVYLFVIIGIIFIANASLQEPIKWGGYRSYSNLDKANIFCNIILSMIYLSLYVISNIIFMANNQSYINEFEKIWAISFDFLEFGILLICVISIALSVKFRKMGKNIQAFSIQIFPIIILIIKYLIFI